MSDREFREFVQQTLADGGVSDSWMGKIMTNENLLEFRKALKHHTADEDENYEIFEYYGDTILNYCIVQWISDTHPEITSLKWMNKIKSLLQSTAIVSEIGKLMGVEKFIIMDPRKDSTIAPGQSNYLKVVEDCVEALCGCMRHLCLKLGLKGCIAVEICQLIIYKHLSTINPPIDDYFYVWDAATQYKEFCDNMKWPYAVHESRDAYGNITMFAKAWPEYNINYVHPAFKQEFSNFLQQNRLPNSGTLTANIVNQVNNFFRGATSRLAYSEKNLNIPTNIPPQNKGFWANQFVTYFGQGVVVATITKPLDESSDLRQLVAKKAVEWAHKTFHEYVPPPPPMKHVRNTKVDVRNRR